LLGTHAVNTRHKQAHRERRRPGAAEVCH
jgi:hypothetical protein